MKVFATGATGLVGANTVRALVAAGHQARLLVRDEAAARRYYARHGVEIEGYVGVDILDQAGLQQAMQGCDALFHAAASISLNPRLAQQTYRNNVGATKAVMGAAIAQGIRNLVYVSSYSVLFKPGLATVDETTPLAEPTEPYSRSKRDSDEYVRGLQEQGWPIQMSYPAAVVGPDDPKLSESNYAIKAFITQALMQTSAGFQCVDVRDLAQAHRFLLENPVQGDACEARYLLGGHYLSWVELRELLERLLGYRLRTPKVPPGLLRGFGAATDLAKRLIPFETPISAEAMSFITEWAPASSTRYLALSGAQFRTAEQTYGDAIRWLCASGHLTPKQAGRMAG
ncbi:MAG: NAD-dependent epimerase/dehydratase family protein [Stagnimonas sp.]|nr:NAD-dependent epimerase/dehydratase family protein [Stagnimonas sp.]